jgi:hypothetical protein
MPKQRTTDSEFVAPNIAFRQLPYTEVLPNINGTATNNHQGQKRVAFLVFHLSRVLGHLVKYRSGADILGDTDARVCWCCNEEGYRGDARGE